LFDPSNWEYSRRVAKHAIAPVDQFPPGTQRRVQVGRRAIAVFNVDGEFHALRDVCPHKGAALSAGTVVRSVTADQPGCYAYDASRVLVRCPWHGWEFDLVTGQSWCDPVRQRTRPYPVSIEPGSALAVLQREPAAMAPGPYVAETIQNSIENDYVVVELDDPEEEARA
jgi:nitrite reductase/ring-hydroxylating ferredoxin subunit